MMSNTSLRTLSNNNRWLWLGSFFRGMLFIMPLTVPWFEQFGLTFTEIMLTQSVYGAGLFLLEVPSGYVADRIGRKKSLFVGSIVGSLGLSILIVADSFFWFCVMEVLLALSVSLTSGADIALLYDTHAELERTGQATSSSEKSLACYSTSTPLADGVAAGGASVILLWSMEAVIIAQVVIGWVAVLFDYLLVEPPRKKTIERSHFSNVKDTFASIFMDDRGLRLLIGSFVVITLTTYLLVWSFQIHWSQMQLPVVWFGLLWALRGLTIGAFAWCAPWVIRMFGRHMTLHCIVMLVLLTCGLMFLPSHSWVALPVFAVGAARGLALVALQEPMNRTIEPHCRATANSMVSFVFRGCALVCAPLMGLGIDRLGMQPTIIIIAGLFIVLSAVTVLLWILHDKDEQRKKKIQRRKNRAREKRRVVGAA